LDTSESERLDTVAAFICERSLQLLEGARDLKSSRLLDLVFETMPELTLPMVSRFANAEDPVARESAALCIGYAYETDRAFARKTWRKLRRDSNELVRIVAQDVLNEGLIVLEDD